MTTTIAVYDVDPDGQTSSCRGNGLLIHPGLVVTHPPLSEQLSDGMAGAGLRAGIAYADGASTVVEIIDITDVEPADPAIAGTAQPLVALRLARASHAPVLPLPAAAESDARELAAALAAQLSPQPAPAALAPIRPPDRGVIFNNPFCRLWPRFCDPATFTPPASRAT
jgi:hypothetical protein